MPIILTVVIIAIVAYALMREGLFTGFIMIVNILVTGLVTFNFYEPLADQLEGVLYGSMLQGYEDALVMVALFCSVLGFLRWATNSLAYSELEFDALVLRIGGLLCGVVTGYLVAGFLMCVLQTLPWHENFMGFEYRIDPERGSTGMRKYLPPDRVWLAMMSRASTASFSNGPANDNKPFDKNATFELRYARYRRYTDDREALPHQGECAAKEEF